MMKINFLALTLLAAFAAPAMAANDFYVGADVGSSRLTDDNLKIKGTSYNLFAGYNFNETFALEGGYHSLVNKDVKFENVTVKTKVYALQLSVIGNLPLSKEFSLFGRLGLNSVKSNAKAGNVSASDSETKALIGLGARYAISPQFGLRAEYQKQASNFSTFSAGVDFRF